MVAQQADGDAENGRPTALRRLWRPLVMLAAVGAVTVAAALFDWAEELPRLEERLEALGALGPAAFIGLRAALAVLAIPGSAVSALGGLVFDPVLGVVCISTGKTIGATVALIIGRYFARDSIEAWLSGRRRLRRLDELVAEHGALVVAFNRLFPIIPFNLQNYAFGLTRVPLATYAVWTWLGTLPGALLVVTGMGVVRRTLETGRVPWALVGALGASVVLMLGLAGYTFLKLIRQRGA
jgi:uncharacterized membrane protein YdjX (TVP38/TMEM64 family)